jgi:hypothetical protein
MYNVVIKFEEAIPIEHRWGESGTTGRRYDQKVAGRTYVFTRNHESGRADRKPRS